MSTAEAWRRLRASEPGEQLLVDLGTSTVTGVRATGAPELAASVGYVGNPVTQTLALADGDCTALGSDFTRAGLVCERPVILDDVLVDSLGVEWLWADGAPAPLRHPLQDADYLGIARYRRPEWPDRIQIPAHPPAGVTRPPVVADAPAPGLLEMCFALRDGWQFMVDITENWRAANALLDWALESVATAYELMLTSLPAPPDIVLYGDDYGYQDGMFLSDQDFRTFVRPRLRTLFSRIRRRTPAAICFHCCGAIRPIVADLADLGADLLNLQHDARGMDLPGLRRALPGDLVLHGYTDLHALGLALERGDRRAIAALTDELVRSAPVIAAPADSLATEGELLAAAWAARFIHEISAADVDQLRRLGPVAAVLDRAARAAAGDPRERPRGLPPAVVPVRTPVATDVHLAR